MCCDVLHDLMFTKKDHLLTIEPFVPGKPGTPGAPSDPEGPGGP